MLPHHHHEEIACYTSTHCEEDASGHDDHTEEAVAHRHDHNTTEEPQHCISLKYYVFSDAGKSLKRIFNLETLVPKHNHFLNNCLNCLKEEPELEANFTFSKVLPIQNKFTLFVKYELPLRAPPAFNV